MTTPYDPSAPTPEPPEGGGTPGATPDPAGPGATPGGSDPYGTPSPYGTSDPYGTSNPYGTPNPYGSPTPSSTPGATPGAPSAYGSAPQPGGGFGQPYYQPPAKTDGVSIAALVTGILGTGPIALILGILGMRRTGPGKANGRGMAIAGIVLGILAIIGWVLLIVFVVFAVNAVDREYKDATARYVTECQGGDDMYCDMIEGRRDLTAAQREAADTCGGRQPAGSLGKCYELAFDIGEPTPEASESPAPEPAQTQAMGDMDSLTEAQLRTMYDNQMSADVKKQLKDPAVHKQLVSQWTSACKGGDAAQCDALGYVADKKKDADAAKVADTCGGQYPDGGMTLKCSYAELTK